jgi:hypothetical protein
MQIAGLHVRQYVSTAAMSISENASTLMDIANGFPGNDHCKVTDISSDHPHGAGKVTSYVRSAVGRWGYCWIEPTFDLDPDRLSGAFGQILSARKQLKPFSRNEAPPGSMSSITGLEMQPLHTDWAYISLPPRYVVLRCATPGEAACPTHFWTIDWQRVGRSELRFLTRPGWIVRGGGARRPFYGQVVNRNWESERFLRFDPCCMTPPNRDVSVISDAAAILRSCSTERHVNWKPGAVLILDNWRSLHGRGVGAERALSRRLERWVIGGHDGMVG